MSTNVARLIPTQRVRAVKSTVVNDSGQLKWTGAAKAAGLRQVADVGHAWHASDSGRIAEPPHSGTDIRPRLARNMPGGMVSDAAARTCAGGGGGSAHGKPSRLRGAWGSTETAGKDT